MKGKREDEGKEGWKRREKHMVKEEEMKDRCIERRSLEKGEGKRDGKEEGRDRNRLPEFMGAVVHTFSHD